MAAADRTMTLGELLRGVETEAPAPDLTLSGLSLDSRRIRAGELFLALRGHRSHGLEHVSEAAARNAAAVAWDPAEGVEPPATHLPTVAVNALGRRAGELAARFFGDPSERIAVVGITGTNGKTSCTQLLAQAADRLGGSGGVVGTLGSGRLESLDPSERTTPDPVTVQRRLADMADDGCTLVAMEVSSHALSQGRTTGTHFLLGVFTNLSRDHLDYHRDMSAYGAAKRRLFDSRGMQVAVLNFDDAFGRELATGLPAGLGRLTYAVDNPDADVRADNLEARAGGLQFRLSTPEGTGWVKSPLLGRFNAANLLAVAGSLHALGWMVNADDVPSGGVIGARPGAGDLAATISRLRPVPARMERLPVRPGKPVVVIDYAHTPDALEQALAALRAHCRGRLVCVFGCGGDRDRGKRPLMGAVAERLADAVYVTDDNPRGEAAETIAAEILDGMSAPGAARVIHDREQAVAAAIEDGDAEDLVLIAGKGHEAYQEVAGVRHAHSDRQAALAGLGEVTR